MDINKYIGDKIRSLRQAKNINQEELAEFLGVTTQAVSRYELGDRKTDNDILFKLADYFNVSINDFFPPLNFDNGTIVDLNMEIELVKIPILGVIKAGIPIEAQENIIDYIDIPKDWLKGGKEYFALKLDGDSMEPEYHDKAIVIFLKTSDCESGQDCCVRINGFDATFKRIKKQENGIMIIPLNENNSSGFATTFYTNEDIANMPIEILGIVKRVITDK